MLTVCLCLHFTSGVIQLAVLCQRAVDEQRLTLLNFENVGSQEEYIQNERKAHNREQVVKFLEVVQRKRIRFE